MGYPKRICKPNLTYHICSRCIGGSHLMELNKFKDLFLKVLSMAEEKYRFEISNYVIMPNHFHIFIKTLCSEDTISQIMQFIKSQYATRYNKMTNRIGPFWNERFKDTIIDYTEDPLYVYNYICTYINFNPVRKNYVIVSIFFRTFFLTPRSDRIFMPIFLLTP